MQHKKLSRRLFLQLSAVTTIGALAACAPISVPQGESGNQDAGGPAAEQVTVSFMVPGSTNEDADFKPVFDAFAEQFPEINGVYAPAGTGYGPQYNEKLLTMLAGGVAPDVFKTLFGNFGSLAATGVYVPLDDYVDAYSELTAFDDFFDAHIEASRFNGELLALPNDGAPEGMWYNVDLYNEAGVDLPGWETDWQELRESSAAISKEEGGIATHFGLGYPYWLGWIWSNGGQVLNAEGTECLLTSPEALEALTYMQDLVVDGIAPGPEALSEMATTERFQTGRLGAYFSPRGALGALRTIEGFAFDAAPLPTNNQGNRMTRLLVGWTSVWSGSKHPDEAYILTAWICSPEGQRLRISRGYAHPSRKSLVEQDWYKNYECDQCASHNVNTVFPEMLLRGEAQAWPAHPKEAQIIQAIESQLDYLWSVSRSPEQVANEMTTEVNKILQSG
jgi:multiple sugar transport system substrate-binding protein